MESSEEILPKNNTWLEVEESQNGERLTLFAKAGNIVSNLKERNASEPIDIKLKDPVEMQQRFSPSDHSPLPTSSEVQALPPAPPEMLSYSPNQKFATTSTVLVDPNHTILNPDAYQVNYCIAAILQAQIFDDVEKPFPSAMGQKLMEDFILKVELPAEYGGEPHHIPESILHRETWNDPALRERIVARQVPTIDTMYRFIAMMLAACRFSIECNMLALIYINRMTGRNNFPLTVHNWRGLWVAAIVLAQKVFDDVHLKTSSFSKILPGVTNAQLSRVEFRAFQLLDFSTTVKPSVYAKYYFELRQLFIDIVGDNTTWKLKPLTLADAKRLELRSGAVNNEEGSSSGPTSTGSANGQTSSAASSASSSTTSTSTTSGRVPPKGMIAKAAPFKPPRSRPKTLEDATTKKKSSRYVIS